MKLKSFLVIIFVLKIGVLLAQEEQQVGISKVTENVDGEKYFVHFISEGQTLFSISRAYEVPVDSIVSANNGLHPDSISPGEVIKIPFKLQTRLKANDSIAGEYVYHIVRPKETLYGIARIYSTSLDIIKESNPGISENLVPGQYIRIPEKEEKREVNEISYSGNISYHKVEAKETLYGIARQYNVSINDIKSLNPQIEGNLLKVGEMIKVPVDLAVNEKEENDSLQKNDYWLHEVMPKENLFRIAKNYAVSIDTIEKLNPEIDENNLQIGQQIKIPKKDTLLGYILHRTEKRNRLNRLARKYEVNKRTLEALNPELDRKVDQGQKVKIPIDLTELADTLKPAPDTAKKEEKITEDIADIFNPCLREKGIKRFYNVALMLPLFLDDFNNAMDQDEDSQEFEELRSFDFLQFYEGFLIALDSMEALGLKANVFVYDVGNDVDETKKILEKPELPRMDLIIGPVYSKSFSVVARFANQFNINIVNPFSPREEILFDNPQVFKVQPNQPGQYEAVANYINRDYPDANIIIVRHNKYQFNRQSGILRDLLQEGLKDSIYVSNEFINYVLQNRLTDEIMEMRTKEEKVLLGSLIFEPQQIKKKLNDSSLVLNRVWESVFLDDSITGLVERLSLVRKNIVIGLTDYEVFAMQLMMRLNVYHEEFDISLVGLPGWEEFQKLDPEHVSNLDLHITTRGLIDYESTPVKEFVSRFRNRFHTEPLQKRYAFDGFDIGYYFLDALMRYGPRFEKCLKYHDPLLLQSRHSYRTTSDEGYENHFWNVARFENLRMVSALKTSGD